MPADGESCSACGSKWRFPLLLGIVLAAILLSQNGAVRDAVFKPASNEANAPAAEQESDKPAQTVFLTINYGDGRSLQNESERWHEGMTVGDLLQGEPRVTLKAQGSGASAFLTELGGVANEGAGGRNWIYSVNGKSADRSFAIYELEPNDHVLWTFSPSD